MLWDDRLRCQREPFLAQCLGEGFLSQMSGLLLKNEFVGAKLNRARKTLYMEGTEQTKAHGSTEGWLLLCHTIPR